MAYFLSREEIYRMLQRELPEGVYPDGAPSAFYSTADMDAVAQTVSTAYSNLKKIYDNFFPQTADEKISDWEIMVFGKLQDGSLALSERRDRVLTKLRSRRGLTIPDMIAEVKVVIGSDKLVEIREWGSKTGGWVIDESQLGIETILNGYNMVDIITDVEDMCSLDPEDFGYTDEQWQQMREEAYTYEVLIYDYTLTSAERSNIDEALSATEPARSQHIITDGLDSADMIEGEE